MDTTTAIVIIVCTVVGGVTLGTIAEYVSKGWGPNEWGKNKGGTE